jgi:hypothetical protein
MIVGVGDDEGLALLSGFPGRAEFARGVGHAANRSPSRPAGKPLGVVGPGAALQASWLKGRVCPSDRGYITSPDALSAFSLRLQTIFEQV